jgi:hypothetical protein
MTRERRAYSLAVPCRVAAASASGPSRRAWNGGKQLIAPSALRIAAASSETVAQPIAKCSRAYLGLSAQLTPLAVLPVLPPQVLYPLLLLAGLPPVSLPLLTALGMLMPLDLLP